MPNIRYTLRLDEGGKWTVLDDNTSQAAHHRNHVMSGMGHDEADAMADLLNQIVVRKNPSVLQKSLLNPKPTNVDEGGMRSWSTHRPL